MILCEPVSRTASCLDALAVLVDQLSAAGWPAGVRSALVTDPALHRNQAFDLLPRAIDLPDGPVSGVILLADGSPSDADLLALRSLKLPRDVPWMLVGRFTGPQALIGAEAKVAYLLDVDVQVHAAPEGAAIPVFGVAAPARRRARPSLLLVGPALEGSEAGWLAAVAPRKPFETILLLDGQRKQAFQEAHGTDIIAWHWGEALPRILAAEADVAVILEVPAGHRAQCLLETLLASGVLVADATPGRALAARGVELLAPRDCQAILPWAEVEIFPRREILAAEAAAGLRSRPSAFLADIEAVFGPASGLTGRTAPGRGGVKQTAAPGRRGVAFMPTNGVGLGHAQRCSLIAEHLSERPHFLAFPSCLKMLDLAGNTVTPLISRSPDHAEAHANDLVNATRIHAVAREKAVFVFDGGYVFDSVVRTATDLGVPTVWVRRGLWQAGQDNRIALDRQKVFSRIIVPREAFEELNAPIGRASGVVEVGPIVQDHRLSPEDRASLREQLASRFGSFDKLVVSMLGGGVAADRSAQLATLCALMERQQDTLHLVVSWPTATLMPTAFDWKRTRVVKTHFAATLVEASDLYISAAGYNSFHESMYRAIPTLFLPQMSAYMDDQEARAKAAADRGLAVIGDPDAPLTLAGQIHELLHGGAEELRAALNAVTLPATGQQDAARLIEELA